MIKTIDDFYSEAEKSVKIFDAFVKKHSVQNKIKVDGICYKCGSRETFERIRALFENHSKYIYQSIISKRRLAYIKLNRNIETTLGLISFLKLSDQKPDNSQTEGFDHIEVYPAIISYDEMVKTLSKSEKVVRVERPHHSTDDIEITSDFLIRCSEGPLILKIRDSEMM
jgi:predicted metalloenzyme YecM